MSRQNPFKKAERGKKWIKLLISGGSGSGKTLTALQIACHLAITLGKRGRVAVIDTEDGTADLYSFDSVLQEPYLCACEQCMKSPERMPLEFDHFDLRDHSPQEFAKAMRGIVEHGYAVGVIDSASHEWCGVNGCLEQVSALKGDGKGRKTDNAWNHVTQLHNQFLSDIRSIAVHLIATVRTKPSREEGADDVIIQRDKDGPFEYEFGFWARLSRTSPGTIHVAKSRSGHFQGEVWKRAGKFVAEQLALWGGHVRMPAPEHVEGPPPSPPAESKRTQQEAPPHAQEKRPGPSDRIVALRKEIIAIGKSDIAKRVRPRATPKGDVAFVDDLRSGYRDAQVDEDKLIKVAEWARKMVATAKVTEETHLPPRDDQSDNRTAAPSATSETRQPPPSQSPPQEEHAQGEEDPFASGYGDAYEGPDPNCEAFEGDPFADDSEDAAEIAPPA